LLDNVHNPRNGIVVDQDECLDLWSHQRRWSGDQLGGDPIF